MNTDTRQSKSLPFLLEIGSEEIPARFIPEAMKNLQELFGAEMAKAHLPIEGVKVWATPRRMALVVTAMATRQPDRQLEIKGPPVSVAFDAAGEPTKAAMGFARKAGVALADCQRATDKRGEFLLARVEEVGREASEVLAEVLPRVILGVPFRKKMRWGNGELEYPRPLQWIVTLLGEDIVAYKVGDIESGRMTRGHRTISADRPLAIRTPDDYAQDLAAVGVMVDHEKRRECICRGLAAGVAACDDTIELRDDPDLLAEVVFLC